MKINFKILYTVVLLAFMSYSCVGLDVTPDDRTTDVEYWGKPNAVYNMINSCYAGVASADEIVYADAMSDNAYVKVLLGYTQSIGNGSYSTADGYVLLVWNSRYTGIRYCNLILDNIHMATGLTADEVNRFTAEAKVMRAYQYFELVSKFGDVPFSDKTISMSESQEIPRTDKNVIIDYILKDLQDVINAKALPTTAQASEPGRLTHWAAIALKARIQLFAGNFEDVKNLTKDIIDNGPYRLFPSYEGLFTIDNENNEEVIWDIQYKPMDREHQVQYQFLPPSLGGYTQIAPLKSLVDNYITLDGYAIENAPAGSYDPNNMFTNRDPRLAATIAYQGNTYTMNDGSLHELNPSKDAYGAGSDASPTGYYIKKYWDNSYRANYMSGLNYILIRYADVLLMYAEALVELNKMDQAAWDLTIKHIRVRAGFTQSSALDYPGNANIKEIIRRERRSELALEGLRTKDIIRWRIAETVLTGDALGAYIGNVSGSVNGFVKVESRKFDKEKHYLWPIPQNERFLNKNLTQNPNW
ncbi:RagB/SusD family nutrient uptake outer membrane protein [Dysgonomonas sp. Marseille-P4677]|uniref:RagB/SusD family nutrient uptake outer membrane protein n=1 Tax=Dysgonomonas sp. Marseille-P4677 TaxID=2364790 RepID=UPI001912E9A5|nr:RagB/SusD family nutrient uptake outer membrane protein [Dysgonomonas sp. Marseille-P4677]MBK5720809.1 RagB/SusD family nutrient uptake outer membrane protein [Dysgonomonas sp. Marseille-P4677]